MKDYLKNIVFAATLLFSAIGHADYSVDYESFCDGFPKVPIETIDGTCIGLVVGNSEKFAIKRPRSVVTIPSTSKILIVDMGSWNQNTGSLWVFDTKSQKGFQIASKLNLPHKILIGSDQMFYVGEAHQIFRFQLEGDQIKDHEVVISDLPLSKQYLHPLKNFLFDQEDNLIVSIGSRSDRCEAGKVTDCISGREAALWKYEYIENGQWSSEPEVLAKGLRNSMALASHRSRTLIQAENSTDHKSVDEPYEEINIIEKGGFYGWPICTNNNFIEISDNKNCGENYQQPYSLMPPHVAPLDMIYYQGELLKPLQNSLIVSWHGYKAIGHRIIFFNINDQGLPERNSKAYFWRDNLSADQYEFTQHEFAPRGSTGPYAQHKELTIRWHQINGLRPEGSPVSLHEAEDGSIYLAEDKNKTILRISVGESYKDLQNTYIIK